MTELLSRLYVIRALSEAMTDLAASAKMWEGDPEKSEGIKLALSRLEALLNQEQTR
jgi:hypothetical protein